jgi:hypothetical protein
LLCRVLDLRYLDKIEEILFLWLLLESGVCILWLNVRRLGSVGDGVEVGVFLCVGRGKVPWLWSLGFLQSAMKSWKRREGSRKRTLGHHDWLSLFSTFDGIFFLWHHQSIRNQRAAGLFFAIPLSILSYGPKRRHEDT